MKLKAFEAHFSCGHFAPKNFKIGSVVKKLSPKNHGVGVKLVDTVYIEYFLKRHGRQTGIVWTIILLSNIQVTLIILLCDQIGGFIKDFHLRSRPWVDIDSTQIRHLVDKKGALLSFPSNHAVNITGIAYFFSKIMKNHTMYFWASAVIIMFSRIYIGVHYPIDIIAGFLLGILISKLIIISWNHLLDEEYKI